MSPPKRSPRPVRARALVDAKGKIDQFTFVVRGTFVLADGEREIPVLIVPVVEPTDEEVDRMAKELHTLACRLALKRGGVAYAPWKRATPTVRNAWRLGARAAFSLGARPRRRRTSPPRGKV